MFESLGYTADELAARGAQHTAREIFQQPDLWREVGRTASARGVQTEAFLRPLLDRDDLRIVLTGAGTSAFAGDVLAPALRRELHRRVDAISTTEIVSSPLECFAEDSPTLLVSFARSGDSPESVAATELAEQCLSEVYHLVVTCNPAGELHQRHNGADRSLVLLMPELSNDKGFAMTGSFTCMTLATWLTLTGPSGDDGLAERLAVVAETILATQGPAARALAERRYDRVVYLGSGPLRGLARESALKLLELTAGGVVSYSDSALGFRHGPKAVLDDRTLALVYLSNDSYTRRYDIDIADELRRALGARSVVAIAAGRTEPLDTSDPWHLDGLDDVADAALALPFVVSAQLLGLQFSLALGNTPDNPFPSGAVNRVVQGVTIHALPQPALPGSRALV
ncbi:SIS domain-containing protein [Pengzhenrongella sicca]|uniref:SIS domain-containing protein n=1 Tax=Pengzhenrongella sicca TaxID=2819238 RepID=A0A8A4ZI04_9MICO|nr:SIS domain-containing protein [Pengzhenrongella sicca]QTE31021.1 SIS domain-containing protein [Pengzhenrongella sicca]